MPSTAPTPDDDERADYVESPDMQKIAVALVRRHPTIRAVVEDLRIGYRLRLGEPSGEGEEAIAKCHKAPPLWRDESGLDIVIWAWQFWWATFDERQREALVLHELCHVDRTEKGGVKLRKHQVEEFTLVVHEYGIWDGFSALKDFAAALARHTDADPRKVTRLPAGRERRRPGSRQKPDEPPVVHP
jgi:hypothetical protein